MVLPGQGLDGDPPVRMGHELVVDGSDHFHLLGEVGLGRPLLGGLGLGQVEEELLRLQGVVSGAEVCRQVIEGAEDVVQVRPGGEGGRLPLGAELLQQLARVYPSQGQGRGQVGL